MKNTFASRGLAHRYKSKPKNITREEVNKATIDYLKKGGNVNVLEPISDNFEQTIGGNLDGGVNSWSFNSIRNHGIVKVDTINNEEFKG